MRTPAFLLALLVAVTAAGLAAAAVCVGVVRADGDPASDVLLGQSVFYPYSPAVSAGLERALTAETALAGRAGFPIKVALIDSRSDLGVVPSLFGRPQTYARFLDQEITFQNSPHPPLLVVMPNGYGVQGLPAASTAAATRLPAPAGRDSDALARAAIAAVERLAAADGKRLRAAQGVGGTGSGAAGGGIPALALVLAGLAALAAGAAVVVARRRDAGRRARPDDD